MQFQVSPKPEVVPRHGTQAVASGVVRPALTTFATLCASGLVNASHRAVTFNWPCVTFGVMQQTNVRLLCRRQSCFLREILYVFFLLLVFHVLFFFLWRPPVPVISLSLAAIRNPLISVSLPYVLRTAEQHLLLHLIYQKYKHPHNFKAQNEACKRPWRLALPSL